jgi:hypothetical protein
MVAAQHYDALFSASSHFLSDEIFGVPDIENVMNTVKFGSERSGRRKGSRIMMAQLQQYWTHGFNDPNYVHKARLTIPKSHSQPSTVVVLATPTLQDLLNPVPADDDEFPPSASAEELYGTM